MVSVLKPLHWVGSSKRNYLAFPGDVQDNMGFALFRAQEGAKHEDAKPLKGFGGAHVLEIVQANERNAFRVVYTVQFEKAVYVLHAFEKKSNKGIATPKPDIDLIRQRLKLAASDYAKWLAREQKDA